MHAYPAFAFSNRSGAPAWGIARDFSLRKVITCSADEALSQLSVDAQRHGHALQHVRSVRRRRRGSVAADDGWWRWIWCVCATWSACDEQRISATAAEDESRRTSSTTSGESRRIRCSTTADGEWGRRWFFRGRTGRQSHEIAMGTRSAEACTSSRCCSNVWSSNDGCTSRVRSTSDGSASGSTRVWRTAHGCSSCSAGVWSAADGSAADGSRADVWIAADGCSAGVWRAADGCSADGCTADGCTTDGRTADGCATDGRAADGCTSNDGWTSATSYGAGSIGRWTWCAADGDARRSAADGFSRRIGGWPWCSPDGDARGRFGRATSDGFSGRTWWRHAGSADGVSSGPGRASADGFTEWNCRSGHASAADAQHFGAEGSRRLLGDVPERSRRQLLACAQRAHAAWSKRERRDRHRDSRRKHVVTSRDRARGSIDGTSVCRGR